MSETGYSVGTCRYCGQCISLDRERETQEEADFAASETCSGGADDTEENRERKRQDTEDFRE